VSNGWGEEQNDTAVNEQSADDLDPEAEKASETGTGKRASETAAELACAICGDLAKESYNN
jgi:hypothetical protein